VHEVHRPGFLSLNCRTPILRRTWAKIEGKGGSIGNNGDIVEVVGRLPDGLMLRDKDGGVGEVRWRRLEHKETGRLLVGFGHAMTIDAAQGITSDEYINALPEAPPAGLVLRPTSRKAPPEARFGR
jgi:hypothetical protein